MPTKPESRPFTGYNQYYRTFTKTVEEPKSRLYSGAIFSFLAISLFGLYAILPTVRTILFLRREIVDKTQVNKQMEDKISALIEAQAQYEAAGSDITLVDNAIPANPKPVELALTLRNLAKTTSASMSALQIASVPLLGQEATAAAQKQPPKLSSFPIALTTNGPFTSLKSYLDGLVSLQRIITIEAVRIAPATETTGSPTGGVMLQLVLQLKAYYQSL